jgi:hypothetical protein
VKQLKKMGIGVVGVSSKIWSSRATNMNSLVAFFDILGTKDLVAKGQWADWETLDFANPVGLIALHYPKMRFAAFSDSVVVSSDETDAADFLTVLNELIGSDFIFVRGGICLGNIRWVDHSTTDEMFRAAKNFAYARVYGSALAEATQLEQKSGPGMICFVSDAASQVLQTITSSVILEGPTNVLAWATLREVEHLGKTFEMLLKEFSNPTEFQRHARATLFYFNLMNKMGKVMPDAMSNDEMAYTDHESRNADR